MRYLASPWSDVNQKKSAESLTVLDGLRGFAALIVIAAHTQTFGLAGQGLLGVMLFFTLSGFVLALPFAEHPDRILSTRGAVGFFINRALRIVPAYVVAVLVIAWLDPNKDWNWVRPNLTFEKGWAHLWSVAEEVRFYALFPIVMVVLALLPSRATRLAALGIMIVAAWSVRVTFAVDSMLFLDGSAGVDFYFYAFLAGITMCFLFKYSVRLPARVVVIAPLLILVMMFTVGADLAGRPVGWCAVISLLIFSLVSEPGSPVSRIMQSYAMRHVGLLSYGLYLFHIPVMGLLEHTAIHGYAMFGATLGITYLVAIISYLLVEKPFLMLKGLPHPPSPKISGPECSRDCECSLLHKENRCSCRQ